jgi:hypothetical protein
LPKALRLGLQLALGAVVAYAVVASLGRSWTELMAAGVALAWRPGPALLAAGVVLATYAMLIETWRRVLGGWQQRLSYRDAARIWAVSNLGRYLPGKVWAVAGMAALAQQAGIAPWAAAGSAIILQALAVGTAAAVVAATVPAAAPGVSLIAAAIVAAGTIAAVSWPPLARRLFRLVPRLGMLDAPPVRPGALALGAAVTLAAWITYGLALKLWAAGTLAAGATGLDLGTAAGAFTASYVIGLLAVFAPGGVVVREGVMFTLLQGPIGPGNALALALGSRVLLTVTEITAALAGLAWRGRGGSTHAEQRT